MGTPCLARPKEPSWSSLAAALLPLDSWYSPHSQAIANLVSPTSTVGRAESVCCPGSAVKPRGDHESAQTRPCDKFCNENYWVLSQHLSAQSKRIDQHHSFPKLSSSCTFSWNVTVAGAHQHCSRHHLCQWYRTTEKEHGMASVQLVPIGPKNHLILRTTSLCEISGKQKNIMSASRKPCWTTNDTKERRHYVLVENNTNSSQSGQEIAPTPKLTQNDTDSPAGDLSHWWAY